MFGFIRIGFFRRGFVEYGLRDDIMLAGPVAEVEQTAAFAAKRELGMLGRVRSCFADGAVVNHKRFFAERPCTVAPRLVCAASRMYRWPRCANRFLAFLHPP